MSTMQPALEVRDAVLRFGGIIAVDNVSFEVEPGTTFGVIGPNGAGKTALLNCVSGVYRLNSGEVSLFGERINGKRPDQITARGLARTFQSTEHFREFSVLDYVMLSAVHRMRHSMLGSLVLWPFRERSEREERAQCAELLDRLGLAEVAGEPLEDLPYGVQKRVDIARAIAAQPRIMLLDEPTSGTTTNERDDVSAAIRMVAGSGVTVVLVDHDVDFVTRHCDRLLVMSYGEPLGVGSPGEMLQRPEVVEAFLGAPLG